MGGTLTLSDLTFAPQAASDPLAGFSGHHVSVQRSGQPYGQPEVWVEVARLWVYESSVTMERRDATHTVTLTSPAGLLERAEAPVQPSPGQSCQDLIKLIVPTYLPFTPTILDTSTPVPIPTDYDPSRRSILQIVEELAAAADVRVYFDALGRLVIRQTLASLDAATSPSRSLGVHLDVTRYELSVGRGGPFANDMLADFTWTKRNGERVEREGRAHLDTGPLRRDGPAGRITGYTARDIPANQTQADKYAASALTSLQQGWVTARIDAVQDPRLEPDDLVDVEYLDRTLRHRIIGVSFDLRTDAMQLTARTSLTGA